MNWMDIYVRNDEQIFKNVEWRKGNGSLITIIKNSKMVLLIECCLNLKVYAVLTYAMNIKKLLNI